MKTPVDKCIFCDGVWQFVRTIYGRPTLIHYCDEKKKNIGWFLDGIPFEVPDAQMGGGSNEYF